MTTNQPSPKPIGPFVETVPQSRWRQLVKKVASRGSDASRLVLSVARPFAAAGVVVAAILVGLPALILMNHSGDRRDAAPITPGFSSPGASPGAGAELPPESSARPATTRGRFVGEPESRVSPLASQGSSELVKSAEGMRPADGDARLALGGLGSRGQFGGGGEAKAGAGPVGAGGADVVPAKRSWKDVISSAARRITGSGPSAGGESKSYSATAAGKLKTLMRGLGALAGTSYKASYDMPQGSAGLAAPKSDGFLSRGVVQETLGLAKKDNVSLARPMVPVQPLRIQANTRESRASGVAQFFAPSSEGGLINGAPGRFASPPPAEQREGGLVAAVAESMVKATDKRVLGDAQGRDFPEPLEAGARKAQLQECIRFLYDRERLILQENIANNQTRSTGTPTAQDVARTCGGAPTLTRAMLAEQRAESERFFGFVARPLVAEATQRLPGIVLEARAARDSVAALDGRLASAQARAADGPVRQTLGAARAVISGAQEGGGVLQNLDQFGAQASRSLAAAGNTFPGCAGNGDGKLSEVAGQMSSAFDRLFTAAALAREARTTLPAALASASGSRPDRALAQQAGADIGAVFGANVFDSLSADGGRGAAPGAGKHPVLDAAVSTQRSLARIGELLAEQASILPDGVAPLSQRASEAGQMTVRSLGFLAGEEEDPKGPLRDAVVSAVASGAARCQLTRLLESSGQGPAILPGQR